LQHLNKGDVEMNQPKFKIGDRVLDAGLGFNGVGAVVSVGPAQYFDCEVRWDKPFSMNGEELYFEPKPQAELLPVHA
jgi:hypothetical protein